MKKFFIGLILATLGTALFIIAADTNFPIYFPNSKLIVKAEVLNRTVYLPLKEIAGQMSVPYTDAIALETLTLRSGNNRLVVTKNSALISFNDQIILLPTPILREDNRWLAPVEFLSLGLTKLTGTEFRYRPGTSRVFAGNVEAPELEMSALTQGPITRITIRCSVPINVEAKREDSTKAILTFGRTPLDPTRERFDHRDRLLHSVAFDDSDGEAKLSPGYYSRGCRPSHYAGRQQSHFLLSIYCGPENLFPLRLLPPSPADSTALSKTDAVSGEREFESS